MAYDRPEIQENNPPAYILYGQQTVSEGHSNEPLAVAQVTDCAQQRESPETARTLGQQNENKIDPDGDLSGVSLAHLNVSIQ